VGFQSIALQLTMDCLGYKKGDLKKGNGGMNLPKKKK